MTTLNLIKQHQTEMQEFEASAVQIGLFIARDAWDALEREVEDYTEDGIMWDFVGDMAYSWALQMGMAFDEACEKWIEQPLYALDDSMREAMGERWCYDINRSSMQNLTQSLRFGNRYEGQFERLVKQARPGLLEIAKRAWKDDEDYVLNHMEEDSIKDGQRVREQFYAARNQFAPGLAAIASELLQRSVQLYRTALAGAQASLLREQQRTA